MAGARWLGGLALASLLAACGSDDDAGGDGNGSGGSAGSAASAGAAGSAATAGTGASAGTGGAAGAGGAGCPQTATPPGDSTHTLEHDSVERQYSLHVPPGYDGAVAVPLIVNFHGYTSNMGQQALFSQMNDKSDSAGFVVVYPNGLQNPTTNQQSWNAGACCAFGDTDRDDVGFVDAVLEDVAQKVCVDQKRIYATGMSNGGFMSHLLGCERANRFAAIAPVAGVLGIPAASCTPARPMPVIHFHGTEDTLVPYEGGGVANTSVADAIAGWRARNECTGQPTQTFENGSAHCDTTTGCGGGVEVVLCTIDGMGHCWPGQSFCPFGNASTDIHANDAMWEFFERFSLP